MLQEINDFVTVNYFHVKISLIEQLQSDAVLAKRARAG